MSKLVTPLRWYERMADFLMFPIMKILTGLGENPQRTHRWNCANLTVADVEHLDKKCMIHCDGRSDAGPGTKWGLPIRHIPFLGGWLNYVVLAPRDPKADWHIGWISGSQAGVSRVKIRGVVRMLLGPDDVSFFGVKAENQDEQIIVFKIGDGHLGDKGPFAKEKLL